MRDMRKSIRSSFDFKGTGIKLQFKKRKKRMVGWFIGLVALEQLYLASS